jgi:hypothetical protein
MNVLQKTALLAAIAIAAVAAAGAYYTAPEARAALGGPVILGGDDLTDHGSATGGVNEEGWLYMQRSLENIEPDVTRSNDGSIAALGSAEDSGGAGDAIQSAADAVGLTVTYYDGAPAIAQFFTDLASGAANPAIIWIAGNGAGNDLDDEEGLALTADAQDIAGFVSDGGGLMSHGTEYGWLTALLPDALAVDSGSSGDLYFTPEGLSDLPALTVDDINAGPWHNHFEGNFGGLQVLVRSADVQEGEGGEEGGGQGDGIGAAVILGGAQVTFEENPEPDPTKTPPICIPPIIGLRCDGPSGGGGSRPQPTTVPATPAPVTTVAAATVVPAVPTRVSGAAGVIVAPDTGDGSGTAANSSAAMLLFALTAAGIAIAATGAVTLRGERKRR